MRKRCLILVSMLCLVLLSGCFEDAPTVRFGDWGLTKPEESLKYSYIEQDKGFQGDGIDSFVYELTTKNLENIESYRIKKDGTRETYENYDSLSKIVRYEVESIEDSEYRDRIKAMEDFDIIIVRKSNDRFFIFIDEINQEVTYLFSYY